MMRYIGLLALVVLFAACRKDLGNYEYKEVNALEIRGIPDTVVVKLGTIVPIRPDLTFTQDTVAGHFTYEWMAIDNATDNKFRLLDTSRNLTVEVPLQAGYYNVYYTVKEKSTGITWSKKFVMSVVGALGKKGWFFMSDVDGKTNVQFWEEDMAQLGVYPIRHTDLLSKIKDPVSGKPLTLEGKPRYLNVTNLSVNVAETGYKYWLYLGSEFSGEKINITNGLIWKNPSYSFRFETANLYPSNPLWVHSQGAGVAYAYYEGQLYKSYSVNKEVFGIPINRLNTGETFKISPYMAVPLNMQELLSIVYDVDNKRFMKHYGAATSYMTALLPKVGGFDPNNVNMDLVYMAHTAAFGGQAVAVLKDAANKRFIARITLTTSGTTSAEKLEEVNLPELAAADHFEVDIRYGFLIYSVKEKLYAYDMDAKKQWLLRDFGAGAEITMLKSGMDCVLPSWAAYLLRPQNYNRAQIEPPVVGLMVGVFNPAQGPMGGKVDIVNMELASHPSYYTFSGFGRVVDIEYINL
ncbi:PKD-like family lipoprotein [Chitinophaga jiangningensis]|nr:PKD-like family lipoprotein [Chitinophaga jiangningensis]